jgi:hypothetical protein
MTRSFVESLATYSISALLFMLLSIARSLTACFLNSQQKGRDMTCFQPRPCISLRRVNGRVAHAIHVCGE